MDILSNFGSFDQCRFRQSIIQDRFPLSHLYFINYFTFQAFLAMNLQILNGCEGTNHQITTAGTDPCRRPIRSSSWAKIIRTQNEKIHNIPWI